MIYFRDTNQIIITPTKVASTALHLHLCKRENAIWVMGPSNGNIEKHNTELPFSVTNMNFQAAVVIRNPWTRVRSFWKHHFKHFPESSWIENFEEWFDYHYTHFVTPDGFYRQCKQYMVYPDMFIIRYENLQHDVERFLGYHIGPVPYEHVSPVKDVPEISYECMKKIQNLYLPDLYLGDYNHEPTEDQFIVCKETSS